MNVYIHPSKKEIDPNTGIGQVVIAQSRHLPLVGVNITESPETADLVVCHVMQGGMPRVDVLHSHGVYFSDIPHAHYDRWHYDVNDLVSQAARAAFRVTVPSDWVAEVFRRDMRIQPDIVGHGIDCDEWSPGKAGDYVLWNKTRNNDVCDALPAFFLAMRGVPVKSTFLPKDSVRPKPPANLSIIGVLPHAAMKKVVASAGVYLATTIETFGIGTLEALASGVPVLGYDWGGTRDLIQHRVNGYLVEPDDYDGLVMGYTWLMENRTEISRACLETAKKWAWSNAARSYAKIYDMALEMRKNANKNVSYVIPTYNYGRYLKRCIDSIKSQTKPAHEIIIVDDGSTDDTAAVVKGMDGVKYIRQENAGVAFARNIGVAMATGDFVVCLDADDYVGDRFTQVLSDALSADRSLGIAYSSLMIFSDGVKPELIRAKDMDWKLMAEPKDLPPTCIPSGSMFRRSMWQDVGGYRQVYAPAEDTDFWVRGLAIGYRAKKATDDGLFFYNVHPGSASRTKQYKRIDTWKPYMRDKVYPFGVQAKLGRLAMSYISPLISVIIPVGPGHARYVPAAVESVEGQTLRSWEIIVVDDCNGEAAAYLESYPFVKYLTTGGVRGAGAARNVGIDAARGKLVFFLDADDYIDPTALQKMTEVYARSSGDYIYSGWYGVLGNEFVIGKPNQYNQRDMLIPGQGHAVSVLMNRADAASVRFDERLSSFEDVEFFVRCAVNGVCGTLVKEPLLYYRLKTGSRRPKTQEQIDRLESEIFDGRYADFRKGKAKMASCCGGGGKSILAAKKIMDGLPKSYEELTEMESKNMSTLVRMEFTGVERGSQVFFGRYRGGDNPTNKYADVSPADVAIMEQTGKWKVVPVAEPVRTVNVPIAPLPEESRKSPEMGETEARLRAAESLMLAKAEAAAAMEEDSAKIGEKLEAMRLYELVEYAEEQGIPVDRKTIKTKAQILEHIKKAMGL